MDMPQRDSVVIPSRKLLDYLLSETHAVGKSKAKFFRSIGFDEVQVDQLVESLKTIALDQPVVEMIESPHGAKYVIDGPISAPNGESVTIRTVWIIEQKDFKPRFVTAYPLHKAQSE